VIEPRQLRATDSRYDRSRLGLRCAKDQCPHPSVHQRTNAHQTGLNRDAEDRAGQPIVADALRRSADRHHFRMRSRVTRRDRLIEPAANDLSSDSNDRPNRHLASAPSALGFLERGRHEPVRFHRIRIIFRLCENVGFMATHHSDQARRMRHVVKRYAVNHGHHFHLKRIEPGDTGRIDPKDASQWLDYGLGRLTELQDKLFARSSWSLLVIFQAMDAAGKDSTIKHVMSGVNPQGCQVFSFKSPSEEELRHDFLWRTTKGLPERGRIGIFNRSYYEEVLAVRVHEDLLEHQHLPAELVTRDIWDERFEDIRAFERHLYRSGTLVLKFMLHVSKSEQRKRILERLDNPNKMWKFSASDLAERARWHDYAKAYEDMIRQTAAPHAPWHVVPADHKWFTRVVVAATIVEALDRLDLTLLTPRPAERRALAAARAAVLHERT